MGRVRDIENRDIINCKNIILIGKNSTAKTYLLEKWLSKDFKNSWYISTKNRNISLNESFIIKKNSKLIIKIEENLNYRSNSDNIDDFFESTLETRRGDVFFGYIFNTRLREKIQKYFNNNISLINNKLSIGDTFFEKISDGLQAIIRIILEIEVAKMLNIKNILIDEIEKGLDYFNSFKMIKFIEEEYKEL
ncbi:hypothetical protein, partial [Cetobacterium sp.]|uniref:hypothetical protein n=1 Tax=Cetobacterium sp. TaxID=2071632 RepID=UPI003EE5DE76